MLSFVSCCFCSEKHTAHGTGCVWDRNKCALAASRQSVTTTAAVASNEYGIIELFTYLPHPSPDYSVQPSQISACPNKKTKPLKKNSHMSIDHAHQPGIGAAADRAEKVGQPIISGGWEFLGSSTASQIESNQYRSVDLTAG